MPSSAFSTGLQLPNELLHKILLWSIGDGLHTLCTTTKCPWEMNMLLTFHCVSIPFRAISREIACKAFYLDRDSLEGDSASFLSTTREIFSYLHGVGKRLRTAAHDDETRHPCSAANKPSVTSPLLVSYAMYLNCTSLRKSALQCSTAETFPKTHRIILSALPQALDLCHQVNPRRITSHLAASIEDELGLARCGLALVEGFREIDVAIQSLKVFESCIDMYGTGPIAAVLSIIHRNLSKIEEVMEEYRELILPEAPTEATLPFIQLPGILKTLRLACTMEFSDDQYELSRRLNDISRPWARCCPFFGD
ncbi:hypothetical protein CC2G_002134 [Coprinopsis cinerea AmutBmut pab1-1]|nr:hypothetical protein CC2G_002134 [Coprinopsis cinerea AmutBmut pab1-1]